MNLNVEGFSSVDSRISFFMYIHGLWIQVGVLHYSCAKTASDHDNDDN